MAPRSLVVLSTRSRVEVFSVRVSCRWTMTTSRFWGPAVSAAPPEEAGEEVPGSLPAYQR